jgi:hypothetical protein
MYFLSTAILDVPLGGNAATGLLLPVLVAEMEELVVVMATVTAEREGMVAINSDLERLEMAPTAEVLTCLETGNAATGLSSQW